MRALRMHWTVLVWFCGLLVISLAGEQAKEEKMEESDLNARFIAKIKTRTRLLFTTDTTTVPFTCATFSSAVCRRRRRFPRLTIKDLEEKLDDSPVELFSGQLPDDVPVDEERKKKRLGITIIGTVTTTTFTLTSTSTNSATTFSVSYFCSAPNVVFPPGC